jgi:HK97 family phage portal protein
MADSLFRRAARSLLPFVARAAEGSYRPPPYYLPISGGWLNAPAGNYWNWWQMGYNIEGVGRSALVEACISAYAQTVAMCPGNHWKSTGDGGRERMTSGRSHLVRILKQPNAYDTISDFLLNLVRNLYEEGNAYALALRNARFEIEELHLMNPRMCMPRIATTGDVFYELGGNDVIEQQIDLTQSMVPARDVLHVRFNRERLTLLGVSPLEAAARDIAATDAMAMQQLNFYRNQARPGIMLATDLTLNKEQVDELRQRWNEQTSGLNAGGTPILTAGLKPQVVTTSPKDAELAEVMKMSQQNIALAFRIPLQLLGITPTSNQFGSTEALMQYWVATGLGFCLNHVEEAFGRTFELRGVPDEYLEFDTSALLRSAFKDRIEGLARAVQGGIYAPNEARSQEDLKKVAFGDEPRVQQQVVPLSAAGDIQPAPGPKAPPPAAPQPAPPKPPSKAMTDDRIERTARKLIADSARHARRRRFDQ